MRNRFFSFLLVSLLLAPLVAEVLAVLTPVGSEFQVNTTTSSNQDVSAVDVDDAGNFVVVWTDHDGTDGDFNGVFGQRYDGNGFAVGGEFQVNTTTSGNQDFPTVAVSGAGAFVIAWRDTDGTDGDSAGIFAQLYDTVGVPVGGEFQVNSTTAGDQARPHAAMDANGNFIITWTDFSGADGDNNGVFAQLYDSSGSTVNLEFQVNASSLGIQESSSVAMNDAGDFVISWTDWNGLDGDGLGVFAQLYDFTGSIVVGEFQVNTTTVANQFNDDVVMDAIGNFVVIFNESGSVAWSTPTFQRYDSAGVPQGGEVIVDPGSNPNSDREDMELAMEPSGNFAVVWRDRDGRDGDNDGIFFRRFDASGSPLSDETQANTSFTGDQSEPDVAAYSGGNILVTWTDINGLDGDTNGVFAQLFTDVPDADFGRRHRDVFDVDGDGTPNSIDGDIDEDGIENHLDPEVDGDGIPNGTDHDIDADGFLNGDDEDMDADGVSNTSDLDMDGDGIVNGEDGDMDGDGIPNDLDPDMDSDGVPNERDEETIGVLRTTFLEAPEASKPAAPRLPFVPGVSGGISTELELLNLIRALQLVFAWMTPSDYQLLNSQWRDLENAEVRLRMRGPILLIGQALQMRSGLDVYTFSFREALYQELMHVLDVKKAFVLSLGTLCSTPERLQKALSHDFEGALDWGVGYNEEIGQVFSRFLPLATRDWDIVKGWPLLQLYELVLLDYCEIRL